MTCKKYSFFCVSPQLFFPTSPTFNYTPFQVGYRYYAERPANGPVWGLRFNVSFLFPK